MALPADIAIAPLSIQHTPCATQCAYRRALWTKASGHMDNMESARLFFPVWLADLLTPQVVALSLHPIFASHACIFFSVSRGCFWVKFRAPDTLRLPPLRNNWNGVSPFCARIANALAGKASRTYQTYMHVIEGFVARDFFTPGEIDIIDDIHSRQFYVTWHEQLAREVGETWIGQSPPNSSVGGIVTVAGCPVGEVDPDFVDHLPFRRREGESELIDVEVFIKPVHATAVYLTATPAAGDSGLRLMKARSLHTDKVYTSHEKTHCRVYPFPNSMEFFTRECNDGESEQPISETTSIAQLFETMSAEEAISVSAIPLNVEEGHLVVAAGAGIFKQRVYLPRL